MKPDVLYFGKFPDATVAELNRRYTVHHYFKMPQPDEIPAEIAARIAASRPKPIAASAVRCSTGCRSSKRCRCSASDSISWM